MDFTTDLIERTYYIKGCPLCGATATLNLDKRDIGEYTPVEIETLSISCPKCGLTLCTENYTIEISDIFDLVVKWNSRVPDDA